jgi:hypothetical protein
MIGLKYRPWLNSRGQMWDYFIEQTGIVGIGGEIPFLS